MRLEKRFKTCVTIPGESGGLGIIQVTRRGR